MVATNELYKKYVTDDLKFRKGLSHPVKSGILTRIKTKNIDPRLLHPNPQDEFSMDNIGPNWTIIGDYEKTIRQRISHGMSEIFDEPLIAVRLDKGGYMLLNGHHRWIAAVNQRVRKVPVKVVNITLDEDIYALVSKSKREKCVTIDFDEVLFSDSIQQSASPILFPYNLVYKKNIRENAALLVQEFQRMGYDVWIYTGSYLSETYIKGLFRMNKCRVDGIVNGINEKKSPNKLREIFREKYHTILHVDNEAFTIVNTRNKKYEIVDISTDEHEWASSVITNVNNFDMATID